MATINKLVYDAREAVRQLVDDTNISDRYIIYLYNILRAQRLRQDANDLQKITDNSVLQTLCLEVEEVDAGTCNTSFDCDTVMRTVRPIPKPLETHLKAALTAVRPTNRIAVPFNFVTKEKALYSKYSPFKYAIYAFLDDDLHIYFLSESNAIRLLSCVTITGIFEDPLELKSYVNCCGCNTPPPCFDLMTTDYPLQPHHIVSIREEIIQNLLRTIQIPEDKNNNSDDN